MKHTISFTILSAAGVVAVAMLFALPAYAADESHSRAEASIRTVINGREVSNIHKSEETTDGSPAIVHIETSYHDTDATTDTNVTVESSGREEAENDDKSETRFSTTDTTSMQQLQDLIDQLRELIARMSSRS